MNINQKDLLNKIYKSLNENYINKIAQQESQITPPTTLGGTQTISGSLAKKLVSRLSMDIAGISESDQFTSGKDGVNLKVDDLKNLSTLILFAIKNKISYNGERIAYDRNEIKQINQDSIDSIGLAPISIETGSRLGVSGKIETANAFITIEPFKKYIEYMQKSSVALDDRIFRVMIGGIVQEFNSVGGSIQKIAPTAKPTSTNSEYPDSQELDSLREKVFNPKSPFGDGNFTITIKDLSSYEDFNTWLQSAPKARVIYIDPQDPNKFSYPEIYDEGNQADICKVFEVLYARANRKLQTSNSKETTKLATLYKTRIEQLAGNFKNGQGIACSSTLTSTTSTNPTTSSSTNNKQNNNSSGTNSSQSNIEDIKRNVVNHLPLRENNISFDLIRTYIKVVSQLERNGTIINPLLNLDSKMDYVSSVLNNNETNIKINTGADNFANQIQQPVGDKYLNILEKLEEIISSVKVSINSFADKYIETGFASKLSDRDQNLVYGQIAFYESNVSKLRTLRRDVNSIRPRYQGKATQ